MYQKRFPTLGKIFLVLLLMTWGGMASHSFAENYRKAVDTQDIVKNKLFPKKYRLELNAPSAGVILNQSYVNTFLAQAGVTYFTNDVWGVGLEAAVAFNQDKDERTCIENFYNDPDRKISGAECGDGSDLVDGSNFGPAYVPIREIKQIVMLNATWSPLYGKQILLRSATSYFDLFVTMGGGVVISDFYPEASVLRNNKNARGPVDTSGAGIEESDESGVFYGKEGRPVPIQETTPTFTLGLGQKFHFFDRFHIKLELRNYTLLGTEAGFDSLFAMWTGIGVRF